MDVFVIHQADAVDKLKWLAHGYFFIVWFCLDVSGKWLAGTGTLNVSFPPQAEYVCSSLHTISPSLLVSRVVVFSCCDTNKHDNADLSFSQIIQANKFVCLCCSPLLRQERKTELPTSACLSFLPLSRRMPPVPTMLLLATPQ